MTVSISTMPPQIQQRYNEKLLSTPEHNCVHMLAASCVEMPDNQGFIDRQSRYNRLDTFPVPLDDAQSNPPPQLLSRVDVDYLAVHTFVMTFSCAGSGYIVPTSC